MQQDINGLLQTMYDEYQAALRRLAYSFGVSESEIDDVVQDTFISYFKAYSLKWEPERQKSMLVKILKHKCIDLIRKNSHYKKVSLDAQESGNEQEIRTDQSSPDPLELMIGDEAYSELKEDIFQMRPEWKEIATLYFLEERSIKEICGILGITDTACRARIYRTRVYLREVLTARYNL